MSLLATAVLNLPPPGGGSFGAPYALVDCEDHTLTGGYGAVLETALSGTPGHDPVGWPTFVDWPAPQSLTPHLAAHSK